MRPFPAPSCLDVALVELRSNCIGACSTTSLGSAGACCYGPLERSSVKALTASLATGIRLVRPVKRPGHAQDAHRAGWQLGISRWAASTRWTAIAPHSYARHRHRPNMVPMGSGRGDDASTASAALTLRSINVSDAPSGGRNATTCAAE